MCRFGKSPRRKDDGRVKSGVARLERMKHGSGIQLRWENRSGVRPTGRVPGLEMTWNPDTNLTTGPSDSSLF